MDNINSNSEKFDDCRLLETSPIDRPHTVEHRTPNECVLGRFLLDFTRALNERFDPSETIEAAWETTFSHAGTTMGAAAVVSRETGDGEIDLICRHSPRRRIIGQFLDRDMVREVMGTGRGALTSLTLPVQEAPGTGSAPFLCAPLLDAGGEPIGAVGVDRLFPDGLSLAQQLQLLTDLAAMIAQAVEMRRMMRERERALQGRNRMLESEFLDNLKTVRIVGASHAIRQVHRLISQVAPRDATVLITGESGTGKELVAEAIHANSPRADKPFVRAPLEAFSESSVERELFGATGGSQQRGWVEMAQGGTLFLDEITHLPLSAQARLIRVLQDREFQRPDGEIVKTDARIIVSSSRNLESLIRAFTFRMDLYYRLNLFPIFIPPLRDRRTDIVPLADHFAERAARKRGRRIRRISTLAVDMMMAYSWPGNVRELESCMDRAVVLTTDNVIYGHHLPLSLQPSDDGDASRPVALRPAIAALERELIRAALTTAQGSVARAAIGLGVSERFVRRRIVKHQIDRMRNGEDGRRMHGR